VKRKKETVKKKKEDPKKVRLRKLYGEIRKANAELRSRTSDMKKCERAFKNAQTKYLRTSSRLGNLLSRKSYLESSLENPPNPTHTPGVVDVVDFDDSFRATDP